jgi:hypothetical protein
MKKSPTDTSRLASLAFLVLLSILVSALTGCCGGPQPDEVVTPIVHEIEDLQIFEAKFIPMIPRDEIDADLGKPSWLIWTNRFRSARLAMEGLLAWSKGEPFDVFKRRSELIVKEED